VGAGSQAGRGAPALGKSLLSRRGFGNSGVSTCRTKKKSGGEEGGGGEGSSKRMVGETCGATRIYLIVSVRTAGYLRSEIGEACTLELQDHKIRLLLPGSYGEA